MIAGKGWNKQEKLNELLNKYKIKDNVTFLDFIPMDDLVSLYGAADAYFQPSFHENCPQTVLEAMSCGIPVVAANNSSLPEAVGDAGLLVDAEDVEALADALSRILDDSPLRQTLIERGLAHAKQFTWERAAHTLLATYEHVGKIS